MSYLINLLNTKTNLNTIINKKTTLNSCIQDFEFIFNYLIKQENVDIKSTIVQGETPSMFIFTNKDKIAKGYFYNSTSKEQVNLYEITLISINIELTDLINYTFPRWTDATVQKRPFKRFCSSSHDIYPIFENEYQPLLSSSSSKTSSSKVSPTKKSVKFSPLDFNQEFVDELKQKLNNLNFGLTPL